MIESSRVTWNEHGDPKVTITLEGWSDVYRFAHNLTQDQVEFCAIGRKILRALKRRWGVETYHRIQKSLHGRVVHG